MYKKVHMYVSEKYETTEKKPTIKDQLNKEE